MLDQYIIYNDQFEVLICRVCKAGVIGVHRHFARTHQIDISFEDRQEIDEYAKGLTLRIVEEVSTPTQEIKAIEGIEIIPGFKCSEPGCQEVCGKESTMESHSRRFHDWNTSKDNEYILSLINVIGKK